jgi:hypothetical protein
LARKLKAIPGVRDVPAESLKPYLKRWHKLAVGRMRTKPFETSWWDFREGWGKVEYPAGRGPIMAVLERASKASSPIIATDYDSREVRLLVKVCRELQRQAGKGTFFLSTRTAGELVGVSHWEAATWLKGLVADGVLELVRKGDRPTRKASEYKYLGN